RQRQQQHVQFHGDSERRAAAGDHLFEQSRGERGGGGVFEQRDLCGDGHRQLSGGDDVQQSSERNQFPGRHDDGDQHGDRRQRQQQHVQFHGDRHRHASADNHLFEQPGGERVGGVFEQRD